ncbi:hypothetical protein [Streptomyces sp. NPDC021224]|uniref:hypothetical protein n=1 Tax=unclassified Streptomyces TaxID=2593676 RepID=UPI0037A17BC8
MAVEPDRGTGRDTDRGAGRGRGRGTGPDTDRGTDWFAERRLAVVCANLERIRDDLRDGSAGEQPLDRVLDAARDEGADIAEPLAALHTALQQDGDSQGLNGYPGARTSSSRSLQAAGLSSRATEPVEVCPIGRCTRHSWPAESGPAPRCAIGGSAFRRGRL